MTHIHVNNNHCHYLFLSHKREVQGHDHYRYYVKIFYYGESVTINDIGRSRILCLSQSINCAFILCLPTVPQAESSVSSETLNIKTRHRKVIFVF